MALPLYLAMTAAEFQNCSSLPTHMGWMACHFSPYGLGLSNCPRDLPEGSMLILNDRIPICGHDPELIAMQLADLVCTLKCGSVLLDFQRPGAEETVAVVKAVTAALPCPVGISHLYAEKQLEQPVFLPPVTIHAPLAEYLSAWQGREIWLEAALDSQTVTVTGQGAVFDPSCRFCQSRPIHADHTLHCHYQIETADTRVIFSMQRTADDLVQLLEYCQSFGVTHAVGMYQELGASHFHKI